MTEIGELGTADVAIALELTDRQIRNLVKSGALKPDRVKKTSEHRQFYYFQPETIEAYKRQRQGGVSESA